MKLDVQDAQTLHPSHMLYFPKLPVELVARIFSALCTEISDDDLGLPYPACLAITHVCRHWRTVALSYPTLWASITPGLSLRWIKVCMERSQPVLMDFDICIGPVSWPFTRDYPRAHDYEDIIVLLSDFTRVGSLCLTGWPCNISLILDSLHSSLPLHSFSLRLERGYNDERHLILSDDLFGGKAPIRRLEFLAKSHIVAPNWLLHGVTHFNCAEPIIPSELLDAFRQMSSLTYFEFEPNSLCWREDDLPVGASPVQMPQLLDVIVHCARDPNSFVLLDRLLLLPVGVKRRLELETPELCAWLCDDYWMEGILPLLEAMDGIQHLHFSGKLEEGWFRMWTGNADTVWEDSEFCLFAKWRIIGSFGSCETSKSCRRFIGLCDTLGAARAQRLVIDFPVPYSPLLNSWIGIPPKSFPGVTEPYWWDALQRLLGIEELELHPARVGSDAVLGGTWEVGCGRPPAC